jgi:chaperonin GroES
MKIRPLHDRVIVKRLEEVRTTASGIVIPDTATEKPDNVVDAEFTEVKKEGE